jgi:PAS domain S-box-containing protein
MLEGGTLNSTGPMPVDDTFLIGGGEIGRLIRARDWSDSSLGPPAGWPPELRTLVALMLSSKFPMFAAWNEQLCLIYNDAYSEILGNKHPEALGRPFHEVWGESVETTSPRLITALAGEASYGENQIAWLERGAAEERAWFTFSYSPVRDAGGAIKGVFCAVSETTPQMEERERQAFRLRLEQRLRDLTDPLAVMSAAAEAIGQELGVSRAGYSEVDEAQGQIIAFGVWTNDVVEMPDGYNLAEFGDAALQVLKLGEIVALDDVADAPFEEAALAKLRSLDIASILAVPLVKSGRLYAVMFLHDSEPRHWRESECALVAEIAERTWSAVERARSQVALRRSEMRFRALSTTGGSPTYRVSADWHYLFAADRDDVEPMSGSPDQIWGDEFVHPDDRAMRHAAIAQAIATREMMEIELRALGPAGDYRWLRSRAVPILDENGEVLEWFGAATNITDRRAAEERLRDSEEQLRLATEASEVGLWDVEAGHGKLFWPPRVKAMFGMSPDFEVTLDDFFATLHPNDLAHVRDAYEAAADPAVRAPYDVEYRAIGKEDGVTRWIAARGRGVFDVDGRCLRMIGTALDISGRKAYEAALENINETLEKRVAEALEERAQAEEALRQAQKMEAVGRLVGGIAHDFNNLLGAVVGSLELIRHRSNDAERVKRYVDVGMQAADRGAKLTAQLLAFSRSQRIELKWLSAGKLITSIRPLLASTLGPMVELRFALEDEDRRVLSDPTQLEMALINLAINARDAMPEGGRAIVSTRLCRIAEDAEVKPGDYLEIKVEDSGCGMTPDVASRALDPFFTTKEIGKGTGLGLSQVYGIAKQAGGAVRIDTEPGRGTAVAVLLPCVEGEPSDAGAWRQPTPDKVPMAARVLIIDDDADMLRVISDSLEMLGYSVAEANNGVTGLRLFDEFAPDLLIVDFAMPGMNGAEVAKAVRERRPDMPIIFASGYSDTEAIERVIGTEAKLLRKPFAMDDLKTAVIAAL